MTRKGIGLVVLMVLVGCTAGNPPELSTDHPANLDAAESALPPPSTTLSIDSAAPIDSATGPASAIPGAAPNDGAHAGHDAVADQPPAHAQSKTDTEPASHEHGESKAADAPATQPARAALYTCPMHPEVVADHPGKCPKCGMKLIKKDPQSAGHGGHP